MSGPSQIQIKRKRDEPGPETLVVERQQKRVFTNTAASQVHYVRQGVAEYNEEQRKKDITEQEQLRRHQGQVESAGSQSADRKVGDQSRRTFHLARPPRYSETKDHAVKDKVATFIEARGTARSPTLLDGRQSATPCASNEARKADHFKRPGKGAAIPSNNGSRVSSKAEAPQDGEHLESVADDLHRFALEELSRDSKPKATALPKLAGARSKELHRQRTLLGEPRIRDEDVDMDDDRDYVYDTYVLAPSMAQQGRHDGLGDVGYLIITEEDQPIWETFVDDEPSDKDWDTDDEDENAEDYYGADYPEDELASDDEYDRNAYGFRPHGASDDEEWDEDTGIHSDDGENDRMLNPWKSKTPIQFVKGVEEAGEDD